MMPRGHSFNTKAGKGRGASPVNHWSDDDESDVEAEADDEALLEALKSATCGTIRMKVAQLKTFAKHADAITVRIPDAIDSANVKAILKRAGNASGNAKAKAVAQLVLDVSRLPITPRGIFQMNIQL